MNDPFIVIEGLYGCTYSVRWAPPADCAGSNEAMVQVIGTSTAEKPQIITLPMRVLQNILKNPSLGYMGVFQIRWKMHLTTHREVRIDGIGVRGNLTQHLTLPKTVWDELRTKQGYIPAKQEMVA